MPSPQSPVVPGAKLEESVIAKDQPPYQPLPTWRDKDGTILTRWHLTWRERLTALFRGDVYLWVRTFNQPLQPLQMQISRPLIQSE